MRKYNISERERELVQKIHEKLSELGRRPQPINWNSRRLFMSLCPFHDDHDPSFNVFIGETGRLMYYCFGCHAKGGIFSLAKRLGIEVKPLRREEKRTSSIPLETLVDIVEKAHEALLKWYSSDDVIIDESNFFVERGFITIGDGTKEEDVSSEVLDFIKRYKLGLVTEEVVEAVPEAQPFSWRLIIPYFNENGEVIWFNARAVLSPEDYEIDGLPTGKYYNPGGHAKVYNLPAKELALEKGYLLVVEGELDAISALEATEGTIPIVGVPGGAATADSVLSFFKELARSGVELILLFDPDSTGRNLATKVRKAVQEAGGHAEIARLIVEEETPEGYILRPFNGDINDALVELGKSRLKDALLELVSRHEDEGDMWFLKHLPAIIRERKHRVVYPTGIKPIDDLLGGGYREGLHIIGGITSAGKTSLALRIAMNNALEGRPVLFFTYEMSKFELWARVISSVLPDVSYKALKDGKDISFLDEYKGWNELKRIGQHLKILEGDMGMIDPTAAVWSVPEIASKARMLKEKTGIAPLVIVDYLQRMPVNEDLKKKDMREKVDYIVSGLQTLVARGVGSPVIALSSISRSNYQISENDGVEKKLSAFKESGGIEFTGYTVVLLWQPNSDSLDGEKIIVFDLLKNRENGRLGPVKLRFNIYENSWEVAE